MRLTDDDKIKREIAQAASDHLHAGDAQTALNHFYHDIVAVSNEKLFPSLAALAKDVNDFYQNLDVVHKAEWDDIHIRIINSDTATFTAKFNYTFTTSDNELIELSGIWTALYVRENGVWKIKLRHESFSQM